MPMASALELVLSKYDVFDVDTLLVMLRSPHNIAQIADLIDNRRKLIDATAHAAHGRQRADRNGDSDGGHNNAQQCQRA